MDNIGGVTAARSLLLFQHTNELITTSGGALARQELSLIGLTISSIDVESNKIHFDYRKISKRMEQVTNEEPPNLYRSSEGVGVNATNNCSHKVPFIHG